MGNARIITEGFYRDFGLTSSSGTEYYLGEDITTEELEFPASVNGLPQVGQTMGAGQLPIYRVRIKQILKADSPHKAIYEVLASNASNGTLVPFGRTSRTSRSTGSLRTPAFAKRLVNFGGTVGNQYIYTRGSDIYQPRVELRLVYTTVQNVTQATIDSFNAANMGKRYTLTGSSVNFLFEGAVATLLPNNTFRIEGQWVTTAPTPAVAAGTYAGIDVALPALGPLDEYLPSFVHAVPEVNVYPVSRIPLGATYPF